MPYPPRRVANAPNITAQATRDCEAAAAALERAVGAADGPDGAPAGANGHGPVRADRIEDQIERGMNYNLDQIEDESFH